MNNKRKNRNTAFIVSSYRTEISADENVNAFIKKNIHYGRYVCFIPDKKRIVFAKTKGYLFAEHLNEYERKPDKFVYIERSSNDTYLLISLFQGAVFYDGLLSDEDQVLRQVQILMSLNREMLQLHYVGFKEDSALFQSLIRELGDQAQVEAHKESLSRFFKPTKAFLTIQGKAKQRSKRATWMTVLIIAVCALLLIYFLNQLSRPSKRVVVRAVVDPYAGYKMALSAPKARAITAILDQQYRHLLNELNGLWTITSITFNGHALVFNITGKNSAALATPVFDLAHSWKMTVNYNQNISPPNAQLFANVVAKKAPAVSLIVPVQKQWTQYIIDLQQSSGDIVKYQTATSTSQNNYKTITVSASIEKVPMEAVIDLLQRIDHYPARVLKFDLTTSGKEGTDKLFYNFSYTIAFYGD